MEFRIYAHPANRADGQTQWLAGVCGEGTQLTASAETRERAVSTVVRRIYEQFDPSEVRITSTRW